MHICMTCPPQVPARVNCCAWTSDGQHLALGLGNGFVSIRGKAGKFPLKNNTFPKLYCFSIE